MNKNESKEYCCVCGEKHDSNKIHEIEVKGKTKKICDECAETIHGLI